MFAPCPCADQRRDASADPPQKTPSPEAATPVQRRPGSGLPNRLAAIPRQCACRPQGPTLQAKPQWTLRDDSEDPSPSPIQAKTAGAGGALAKMERAFGQDFSKVRLFPDSRRAADMGAVAFTQGSDVHFSPGSWQPHSAAGQALLGHELAHVVQQRQGRVKPTGRIGGAPLNDSPTLEQEADRMGARAAAGQHAIASSGLASADGGAGVVQGVFPDNWIQEVNPDVKVPAWRATRNEWRNIKGVFTLLSREFLRSHRDNKDYLWIKRQKSGHVYLVDKATAADASRWLDVDVHTPNSYYYTPRFPKPEVPESLANRRGRGGNNESVLASRPMSGNLKRPFISEDSSAENRAFVSEGKKSVGKERVTLLQERERQGRLHQVTVVSPRGEEEKVSTSDCEYCEEQMPIEGFDADHVFTNQQIIKTLEVMATTMNKNNAYRWRLQALLNHNGMAFDDYFRRNDDGWFATDRGYMLLYNNTRNLVLACKRCNQSARGAIRIDTFLKENLIFRDFIAKLPDKAPGRFEELARDDGQLVAEKIKDFKETDPLAKKSIESHRQNYNMRRRLGNRTRRAVSHERKGQSDRSKARFAKNDAILAAAGAIDKLIDSDDEDKAKELVQHLPEILKPLQSGAQRDQNATTLKRKQERAEGESDNKRRRRNSAEDDLKKKRTWRRMRREEPFEQEREDRALDTGPRVPVADLLGAARKAERKAAESEAENKDLKQQNSKLGQALARANQENDALRKELAALRAQLAQSQKGQSQPPPSAP